MAGYSGSNAPVGDKRLSDMTSDEFKERGLGDMFNQVQGLLQEHPEYGAAALAQLQAFGAKKDEPLTNATDDELKSAGLMDSQGNLMESVRAKMQENPKMSIAMALAAAGLAVAGGLYAYKKFSADNIPVADLPKDELNERGLLDSSGNMLESVKAKIAENPKMSVAAALAATGLLVVGGIAISKKWAKTDTPVADCSNEELQSRGLLDATGGMLEPVKAALANNPKMSIAAALAATGLVVAGGVAVHHSSSADTPVAEMTNEQLEEVGLADASSGGVMAGLAEKIKKNPKMSVAAALAAAAALGGCAYAVNHAMNKPKKDEGKKGKKGKEKKDKGAKNKDKKEKAPKEKKEKAGKDKKDKKGKTKDIDLTARERSLIGPIDSDSSDSDSSADEKKK